VALTTEESELESLYSGLFKVSGCNNADSELAKQMKEQLSCVISDGAAQFFNAAPSTLGVQKSIATCSLHVKKNTRKRCKTGWNEKLFWRLHHVGRETLPGRIFRARIPRPPSTISALNSMMICPLMVALGQDLLTGTKEYAPSVERARITRSNRSIRSKYP